MGSGLPESAFKSPMCFFLKKKVILWEEIIPRIAKSPLFALQMLTTIYTAIITPPFRLTAPNVNDASCHREKWLISQGLQSEIGIHPPSTFLMQLSHFMIHPFSNKNIYSSSGSAEDPVIDCGRIWSGQRCMPRRSLHITPAPVRTCPGRWRDLTYSYF